MDWRVPVETNRTSPSRTRAASSSTRAASHSTFDAGRRSSIAQLEMACAASGGGRLEHCE
jgi:hypothetical protein